MNESPTPKIALGSPTQRFSRTDTPSLLFWVPQKAEPAKSIIPIAKVWLAALWAFVGSLLVINYTIGLAKTGAAISMLVPGGLMVFCLLPLISVAQASLASSSQSTNRRDPFERERMVSLEPGGILLETPRSKVLLTSGEIGSISKEADCLKIHFADKSPPLSIPKDHVIQGSWDSWAEQAIEWWPNEMRHYCSRYYRPMPWPKSVDLTLLRSVQIRRLAEEDIPDCLKIYRTATHLPTDGLEEYETYLRENLGKNYFVADQSGQVIATGGISFTSDNQGYLTYGLVHSDQRCRGIGTLVLWSRLAALREWAAQLPNQTIFVSLTTFKVTAPHFIRRGFHVLGEYDEPSVKNGKLLSLFQVLPESVLADLFERVREFDPPSIIPTEPTTTSTTEPSISSA